MALPASFLDELRTRTPLAAVIGRRVRLARSGKQWKGCCPFHNEKTPSFYVYEDGYHCFGCGAHGDAITFIMASQGASFIEAVEQLASEAGMEVPKPTPEAAEAEKHRHDLISVLAAAEASFRRRLFLPEGRHALNYLKGRGLSDETIHRFGLGWSGEGRGTLAAELGREGIKPEHLIEAGLLRKDDATGRLSDSFFSRVMFPIRDRRGRTISFGGRIMGDGHPKYVNGPETALFSKRRNLYALDLAREGVRGGASLVVVEGYMDVIALHQAGFTGAVAPLGTALTEEQFEELWRLSPVPILCFDGDAAGARATARAVELALPMLTPDRTLRVASLPGGEDPDTLVQRQGIGAFNAVLDGARPLADALYELMRESSGAATPEQRAALRNRLEEVARRIPDRALASEYRRALLDRFYAVRRRPHGARPAPEPSRAPARPTPDAAHADGERLRILIAILLRHPALLHDLEHAFAGLDLPPEWARLREALRRWLDNAEVLDSQRLINHLTSSGLQAEVDLALAVAPVPLPGFAAAAAMPAEAEAGWWHIFGLLSLDRLREEVGLASVAFTHDPTPENERRVVALRKALNDVVSGDPEGVGQAA